MDCQIYEHSEGQSVKVSLLWFRSSCSVHTCYKLWTEIREIKQNFKRDLIKYCKIFTKIILELPKYNPKSFILM